MLLTEFQILILLKNMKMGHMCPIFVFFMLDLLIATKNLFLD